MERKDKVVIALLEKQAGSMEQMSNNNPFAVPLQNKQTKKKKNMEKKKKMRTFPLFFKFLICLSYLLEQIARGRPPHTMDNHELFASAAQMLREEPFALHVACQFHGEMVSLLIQAKANVDARNDNQCTALGLACTYENEQAARTLLAAKANLAGCMDNCNVSDKALRVALSMKTTSQSPRS